MAPSVGHVRYLINHVVLPFQLPQSHDYDPNHERLLLEIVIEALQHLKSQVIPSCVESVVAAIDTINNLRRSRDNTGNISEIQLTTLFNELVDDKINGAVPLEVNAQNAGILIRRCAGNIVFETFELSPLNESAMKCKGRLKRTFPALASSIPIGTLRSVGVVESLSDTLAKASTQLAKDFQCQSKKAGHYHDEGRNTNHPGIVTDLFLNLTIGLGEPIDVARITKHTRQEILFKRAQMPWRRSPLWLLIRVVLQMVFARIAGDERNPHELYKAFMVQLLCRVLESAKDVWEAIGTDALNTIHAKLVRRMKKMDNFGQHHGLRPGWTDVVHECMIAAQGLIETSWNSCANDAKANINLASLQNLRVQENLNVKMPSLDGLIAGIGSRQCSTPISTFKPTYNYPEFPESGLPTMSMDTGECRFYNLVAVETWIDKYLSRWLNSHRQDPTTCGSICNLTKSYHIAASAAYADLPQAMSVMYLTLLDLWMACDSSACSKFPLLRQYDPEIQIDSVQCLLLPLKSQLARLHTLERYVQSRKDAATEQNPSVFRDFGLPSSFAVAYFDQTPSLQNVKSEIERIAAKHRAAKCLELAQLKQDYRTLMDKYNEGECQYVTRKSLILGGQPIKSHKDGCSRCAFKRQADDLSITVYEWPLSENPAHAKATVFELNVPEAFKDWRDESMYIMTNVLEFCSQTPTKPKNRYELSGHHELKERLSPRYSTQRIVALSEWKPHLGTHYREKEAIPNLEESKVCPPNGLLYRYFDKSQQIWSTKLKSREDLPQKFLHTMPPRSTNLARFISRPPSAPDGLPSNEVVASLSQSPTHFSNDEFKALAAIPLGRNIVFANILAQLAMPSVDFAKIEIQVVIAQVVHQAGPPKNEYVERATHRILTEDSFGNTMLDKLETATRNVAQNWDSWRALAAFAQLARRVLSLSSSADVIRRCLEYLQNARRTCMGWLHRLKERAATTTNGEQRTELYTRVTEIALLCTSTYDVEDKFLNHVLEQPRAVTNLLQCCLQIRENHDSVRPESVAFHKTMMQEWRSVMYRMFNSLHDRILSDSTGLNEAVLCNWAAFQLNPEVKWKAYDGHQKHCFHILSGGLPVHFNLLSAELLINGLPLARLPIEFTGHFMYLPLFKNIILDVAPTDQPGMTFSAKSTHHGYKLHFGMKGQDMLVVAIGDGTRLDLVPSHIFTDRLPRAFLTDYIHWYDHEKDEVVFRDRKQPWNPTREEWRLKHVGAHWCLAKGSRILLDMASQSARAISTVLKPVEVPQHIHVILDTTTATLDVDLPRLCLSFFMPHNDTRIHSRQYRGMIIDEDQSMQTLVGLKSRLVLRNDVHARERQVLIPAPQSFESHPVTYFRVPGSHHVAVTIDKDKVDKSYVYTVDCTLGRILDSGDLQSKLLLAYLHALTSHCLPDTLTGRTGTESALSILRSAAVYSFEVLNSENIALLTLLAKLSPTRVFYPDHVEAMQQIGWDEGLPALSQHPDFHNLVRGIFGEAEKMKIFYPNTKSVDLKTLPFIISHLEDRDRIRSSAFRVSQFGAEDFTISQDRVYESRDLNPDSGRGRRAFAAASMIIRDDTRLLTPLPEFKTLFLSLGFKNVKIKGLDSSFQLSRLRFDTEWLSDAVLNLAPLWCSLHQSLATQTANVNKYNIMTWLATMAFAQSADMDLIQVLGAFYRISHLHSVKRPKVSSVELSNGISCSQIKLMTYTSLWENEMRKTPEGAITWDGTGTKRAHMRKVKDQFARHSGAAMRTFVSALDSQWPILCPSIPRSSQIDTYINVQLATPTIKRLFRGWFENRRFVKYLDKLSTVLAQQNAEAPENFCHPYKKPAQLQGTISEARSVSASSIFVTASPPDRNDNIQLELPDEPEITLSQEPFQVQPCFQLKALCDKLYLLARQACEEEYVTALEASCDSLETWESQSTRRKVQITEKTEELLREYKDACQGHFDALNDALEQAVQSQNGISNALAFTVKHIPRISPTFWLGFLNRNQFATLTDSWKTAIIDYGLAITRLHRAHRLFAVNAKPQELATELDHVGHSNWDPRDFPKTLLLEAESGIMVRHRQEVIAAMMRSPPDNTNTVMQLNMGEGKSSTIVPMTAAFLADRGRLVRIIVAKSQSKQMRQMLISKLGGLLNRRIYHMPFSRALRLSAVEARNVLSIYQECMANQGVLLIQPEHILSFKLMALESLMAEGQQETAQCLLQGQEFFDKHSRDIVDESDENFNCRFELIYTMGSQKSIEYAPERWLIMQNILGLVPRYAQEVAKEMPLYIEIHPHVDARFPMVRTLHKDAADKLLNMIAKHVVNYGISNFPIRSQSSKIRNAVEKYLTRAELTEEEIQEVECSTFWSESTIQAMLLTRGLIAGGILRFVLSQKRWRVNYGLDPDRIPATKLAVPFRFKDGPAARSEYSHPDVLIPLTLLSYYYRGLSDEELFDSFNHLLNGDQASVQYSEWIRTASSQLPVAFQQISGVSIKDRLLCIERIFPHLRFSKNCIDYYLTHLVFPKGVKEHEHKLSASGWDLGAVKTHPITGFSGTNDTRHLLPLTVKHLDLDSQRHTNALVLKYLLQDETAPEVLIPRTTGSDAEHLLLRVSAMTPEVRVILDCGAVILEQNNKQVAETWLAMADSNRIQAAVYFDDEQLSVLDRRGRVESFVTSPFAKQLDVCVIYLDESHTRGTDMKLPRDFRAALTLGADLCKDKLVQAAMRMRQLGHGQTVVFVMPQEISTKIHRLTRKPNKRALKVEDVLFWCIAESWAELKKCMPIWSVQGVRFEAQKQHWKGIDTKRGQAEAYLEPEAQTLEARYRPAVQDIDGSGKIRDWDTTNPNIAEIVQRCQNFGAMGFSSADLDEEQERELAPEKEEERQVHTPPKMDAATHKIHEDVEALIRTGLFSHKATTFRPAFEALNSTSAGKLYDLKEFPAGLLVTEDFMRTIKTPAGTRDGSFITDSYLRPAQWVLSVPSHPSLDDIWRLILISPFEANEQMNFIKGYAKVTLHVFLPRTNVGYAALDKLDLYTIGRRFKPECVPYNLTLQLNLFTGSLYVNSYDDYSKVCDSLGLLRTTAAEGQQVLADGFITPPAGKWGLETSPVYFLRALLMRIRREGDGLEKTHLGKILNGMRLEEADFNEDVEMSGA